MRREGKPPHRPRQVTDAPTIGEVRDFFAAYRTDPEAAWQIAALADTDPSLRLGITAIGGGTVGRSYANAADSPPLYPARWRARVSLDGHQYERPTPARSGRARIPRCERKAHHTCPQSTHP